MRLVVGALCDPTFQQGLLRIRQRQMRLGRRHHVVFVVRVDPPDHLALAGIARFDDRPSVVDFLERAFPSVEAELGLPLRGVRSVAAEAPVRQQRADLEAEVDAIDRGGRGLTGVCGRGQAGERGTRERRSKSRPDGQRRFLHRLFRRREQQPSIVSRVSLPPVSLPPVSSPAASSPEPWRPRPPTPGPWRCGRWRGRRRQA